MTNLDVDQTRVFLCKHGQNRIITKTRLFKYIESFTTKKKRENFQIKKQQQKNHSDIFHISALNIDCGHSLEPPRQGDSNTYTQSMLSSRNKKNNVYPCKPKFYHLKWGLWGSKLYRRVMMMKQMHTLSSFDSAAFMGAYILNIQ